MFAHTVSHRTKSIRSRPLSWMTTIPEYYDEYPIASMSRTPSTSSSHSTSSVSPPSSRATSIMHHSNDSEATIANDILILQLTKDQKLQDPYSNEPESPVDSGTVPAQHLNHPLISLSAPPTSATSLALPPPSAYFDIADQNPWEATDGAESIYSTFTGSNDSYSASSGPSSPDSAVSPLSLLAVPAIPRRNSSRVLNLHSNTLSRSQSVASRRSVRSTASSATTIGGPRNKYSTQLFVQKPRVVM